MTEPESTNPTADSVFERYLAAHGTSDAVRFSEVCQQHADLADELRALHAAWRQVDETLEALTDDDPAAYFSELFGGLQDRRRNFERYEIRRELGRGGMGVVLEVWDKDLERSLAMKRTQLSPASDSSSPDTTRAVGRFLEEAQITGQLVHPGIVSVHELGLDDEDRLYFTMQRIDGDDLGRVLENVRDRADGWTVVRALSVLLRSCEAVAYAHDRGVIHRDLKPANIMVGRFGETYVMDWGLARLKESVEIRSVRRTESPTHPNAPMDGSPLMTRHGDVLGTPAYMPPEQADGRLDEIGPHSDVYAMGAILYHLLSGLMPYGDVTEGKKPEEVWNRAMTGPPTPLTTLSPRQPPELIAICEKAMGRAVVDRYPTMEELANDLRAYLENRAVAAHATGPWVEFRKWIVRNRALAFTALGSILVIVVGSVTTALVLSNKNETISLAQAAAENKSRAAIEAQDFTIDLFRAIDPMTRSDGHDLLASELLDRGAEQADRISDPAVRSRVRYWIGNSYFSIGRLEDAVPALELALEEATDPTVRLDAMAVLGATYALDNRDDEARETFENGLAEARRELGDDHPTTNIIRSNLGSLYVYLHEFARAERFFRTAMEAMPDDPNVAVMSNLADAVRRQGRLEEAESILREALEIGRRQREYGPAHIDTVEAVRRLAILLMDTGRVDEATELFDTQIEESAAILGRFHLEVCELECEIARRLVFNHAEEAERRLLAAREPYVLELGDGHSTVELIDTYLAVAADQLGRYEEAERGYRKALASYDARFGRESGSAVEVVHHLGRLLLKQGKGEDDKPLLERLRSLMPRGVSAEHDATHAKIDAVLGPPGPVRTGEEDS